jgi:hypothetical protein
MDKSVYVQRLDQVQAQAAGQLKPLGFRRSGRTFNRQAPSGFVQVVNFQMGQYPVGDSYELPPMRINLYGKFTVNLGVYVPEVAELYGPQPRGKVVQHYDCQLRARLGDFIAPRQDRWWPLDSDWVQSAPEVLRYLLGEGLGFLERFSTQKAISQNWVAYADRLGLAANARIVAAVLAHDSGSTTEARRLLKEQYERSLHIPAHLGFLEGLSERLTLGPLGPRDA